MPDTPTPQDWKPEETRLLLQALPLGVGYGAAREALTAAIESGLVVRAEERDRLAEELAEARAEVKRLQQRVGEGFANAERAWKHAATVEGARDSLAARLEAAERAVNTDSMRGTLRRRLLRALRGEGDHAT